MSEWNCIDFSIGGGIARIRLNRPDSGNAINLELARELARAALLCDSDPTVKAALISGGGRMFCVGGDLKAFAAFGREAGIRVKEIADELHRAIAMFSRMDAVIVVAVNGVAAGAGFSLALIGDHVLAAESSKFTMAYTAAGLTPDGSATYFLPRLIGLRKAQELILLNRTLTASEALQWGIVTQVAADDRLHEDADAICARFAAGPKKAYAAVKQLLSTSLRAGLEEQMEHEGRAIARAVASEDGKEGVAAFMGKRKPKFR